MYGPLYVLTTDLGPAAGFCVEGGCGVCLFALFKASEVGPFLLFCCGVDALLLFLESGAGFLSWSSVLSAWCM